MVVKVRTKIEGGPFAQRIMKERRAAAHFATDKAIGVAIARTRQTIKGVGLGGLANAVGSQSSRRKKQTDTDKAYGAIFARGKPGDPENRGERALLAYSRGASIFPRGGKQWLAFATSSIPKRVGRYKMTPARYRSSGLVNSLGPLVFVPINSKVARLVVRKVEVSRRTGVARAQTGRSRAFDKKAEITAFILIRYTMRAARFSQDDIVRDASLQVPDFIGEYLSGLPA